DLTAGGTPNNIRWTPFLRRGCRHATVSGLASPQDTESFFFHKRQASPAKTGKKRNGIGCVLFLFFFLFFLFLACPLCRSCQVQRLVRQHTHSSLPKSSPSISSGVGTWFLLIILPSNRLTRSYVSPSAPSGADDPLCATTDRAS